MRVTLRKAHKLDLQIKSVLAETRLSDIMLDEFETANYKLPGLVNTITEQQQANKNLLDNALVLITARSQIRRLIQTANEESGLNNLISNRKLLQNQLSLYQSTLHRSENVQYHTFESLFFRLKNIRSEKPTYASRPNLDVPILSPDSMDRIKGLVKHCRSVIENLDEEILAINSSTYVDLSLLDPAAVEALEKAELLD